MITLASSSPRRIELLKKLVKHFSIEPSDVSEGSIFSSPSKMTKDLAKRKAQQSGGDFVIAADTTVYYKGTHFGKPITPDCAFETLSALSGKWHKVCTGVCIKVKEYYTIFSVSSKVKLKKLEKKDILSYIDLYKPLDKAGSYGIQDLVIVEKYSGSFSSIMGLPLERLEKELKKIEKKFDMRILNV